MKTSLSGADLPRGLTLAMAFGAGVLGASLHYQMPMLAKLAGEFSATPERVGLVPMATLGAYALGIFFLVPLGDRFEKRTLVLGKSILLALSYAVAALSVSLDMLVAVSICIGVFGSATQDIVPLAARIAPPGKQGRVLGQVMTGIFLGILFGRSFGGLITEYFGWRAAFAGAALITGAVVPLLAVTLPKTGGGENISYAKLMASVLALYRRYPELRQAVTMQGMLLIAYAAFWATLAPMLESAFGLGPTVAGLFAIPGAAGSVIASHVGRWSDAYGPRRIAGLGPLMVATAFLVMGLLQSSIVAIVIATMLFDLGIRTAQVANQSQIYALDPKAGARLNSVLFLHMFGGQAIGAISGSITWAHYGWTGVMTLCVAFAVAAIGVHLSRR